MRLPKFSFDISKVIFLIVALVTFSNEVANLPKWQVVGIIIVVLVMAFLQKRDETQS